jgi:glutamine cyclotransferase
MYFFTSLSLLLLSLSFEFYHSSEIKQSSSSFTVKQVYKKTITSNLYTQGMFFSPSGNYLFESSGLYGKSKLVLNSFPELNLIKSLDLPYNYFAEGIAFCKNTKIIYMLTWKERTIFAFSYPNLDYLGTLPMDSNLKEGWGLASYSDDYLIASDGSEKLFFLDCNKSLQVVKILPVILNNNYIFNLNALEYAKGYIWANIYFDNRIMKINPLNGRVEGSYDMSSLVNFELTQSSLSLNLLYQGNVLNGIAFNKNGNFFLLTGKNWGYYYQVYFN